MKRNLFKEKAIALREKELDAKNNLLDSFDATKRKSKKVASTTLVVSILLVIVYALFWLFNNKEEEESEKIETPEELEELEEKNSLLGRGITSIISSLITKSLIRYLFKNRRN